MSNQRDRVFSKLAKAAEAGKKRESYLSFGNEGLTATVGASGRLLRISQHFSGEGVGYCVDDPEMPEPYSVVERFERLLEMAADAPSGKGIGVCVDAPNYPDGLSHVDLINHRWPTFHRKTKEGERFTLQYAASRTTIYQKFGLCDDARTLDSNKSENENLPLLTVRSGLLLRDLDFVDSENDFNKSEDSDSTHVFWAEGNAIFRKHGRTALRILALSNTNSLEFIRQESPQGSSNENENEESDSSWALGFKTGTSENTTGKLKEHNIILAYTLVEMSDRYEDARDWIPQLSWEDASAEMNRLLEPYADHTWCDDPTLNFFLNRNLEYILSVCSIPVPTKGIEESPVALTCGDIDSHRVATLASFYSFNFLLLGLQYLDQSCRCGENGCAVRARIEKTCKGHMRWLFKNPAKSPTEDFFCPNYWVNGQQIQGWIDNEYLPGKSPIDTALHIIKAGSFCKISKDIDYGPSIDIILKRWIEDMDETTNWEHYMFPRDDSEPTRSFYLTDHALIWQAIKSAEDMGVSPTPQLTDRDYKPSSLRQAMMKGFTVQNHGTPTQQSTIAVIRGLALNRFALGPKETILAGPIESGFFDEGSGQCKMSAWENTVAKQFDLNEVRDDPNDTGIDPRSHILSILQFREYSSQDSARDTILKDLSTLLGCSSFNGLFPGNLNQNGKPAIYGNDSQRDSYWSNVFEIPYVLCKSCLDPNSGLVSFITPFVDPPAATAQVSRDGVKRSSQIAREVSAQAEDLFRRGPQPTIQRQLRRSNSTQQLASSSMTSGIDANMVAFEKELFSHAPTFFVPPIAISQQLCSQVSSGSDPEDVEPRVYRKARRKPGKNQTSRNRVCDGILIDTPRPCGVKKKWGNGAPMERIRSHQAIEEVVNRGRSPKTSKKRFWIFFSSDPSTNDSCIKTVSGRQKKKHDGKEDFFHRHKSYAKMFSEEIAKPLNKWKTEFHLAIYDVLSETMSDSALDLRTLARGMISFELEGDMSGQYWTCHFLEANPNWHHDVESHFGITYFEATVERRVERLAQIVRSLLQNGDANSNNIRLGKDAWHRRQVLEIIIFGRALEKMHLGANSVLEAATSSIRKIQPDGTESLEEERNYDVFVRKTKRIRDVLKVLQTVKGGLDENIGEVELWVKRQDFRKKAGQSSADDKYTQEVIQNLEGQRALHSRDTPCSVSD